MRNKFAKVMESLAKDDKDVCLLAGDIGNRMFDQFKDIAPQNFINCGIAEANMMSMAAGMALSGLRPVLYTITPFITSRCFEQVKISVGYHEAPVVIVGTGSGLSYAELGATHHSLEDIALMKSIPNLQICAPADSIELEYFIKEAIYSELPTYIRIGKKGEPNIKAEGQIQIGKARMVRHGAKVLVLTIGPIVSESLKAAQILSSKYDIEIGIATMGSVRPLDINFLRQKIIEGYTRLITLEEHYDSGGLGSTVLEWLNKENIQNVNVSRMGIKTNFIHKLGSQQYVRAENGIDFEGIIRLIHG